MAEEQPPLSADVTVTLHCAENSPLASRTVITHSPSPTNVTVPLLTIATAVLLDLQLTL